MIGTELSKSTSRSEIQDFILDIIGSKFDLHYKFNRTDNYLVLSLISGNIRMPANHMVYLFYFLELKYGIRFNEPDIDSDDFFTVSGLASIVLQKLS